jgi:peptidoglycan/xylan/chitin deacetylase (PgdA/CDA1 family)
VALLQQLHTSRPGWSQTRRSFGSPGTSSSSSDLVRNVRLHLGDVPVGELPRPVRSVLEPRRVPTAPMRAAQRISMKLGRLDWTRVWLERLVEARRSVLAEAAAGPPRFLVRVDEFPYATSFDRPQDFEMSRRFHDVLADAGIPYLMAATPQPSHAPLSAEATGSRAIDEREIALLQRMSEDGVTFAQHGNTHRTRFDDPRRRSELCGLQPRELLELLDDGRRRLLDAGAGETRVFVPPFNRFDAEQYPLLAKRFEVICGGPESVALMGFHGGPLWRDGAVYLPCYSPLYADAQTVFADAERMIELAPGTWIPIVLHISWESGDDFAALRRLAELIAPYAASWEELLADVARSASAAPADPSRRERTRAALPREANRRSVAAVPHRTHRPLVTAHRGSERAD